MKLIAALLLALLPTLQAQDTNPPAARLAPVAVPAPAATNPPTPSDTEIVTVQGIKIWKKGRPTNAYTSIGNESLKRMRGFAEAANKISWGVQSRKGNAAIVNSIVNSQRLNFDMNTQDERLDGIDVRYEIIFLKP